MDEGSPIDEGRLTAYGSKTASGWSGASPIGSNAC